MTAKRTAPAPRRRAKGPDDDPATRKKLVEAAIRTILDKGFYLASSNAIAEAAGVARAIDGELGRLTSRLFAGTGIRRESLRGFPFHILRGLALSEVMLRALPYDTETLAKDIPAQRRLLARALSLLIEEESAATRGV